MTLHIMCTRHHNSVRAVLVTVTGEKPVLVYLLSDNVGIMRGLCLESAVVGP